MIGETISHYKILEKLGEGGMGVVYRAEDTKLHRTVALKFLRPEALDSEELKTRFLHEAEAAAALTHPNICVVHEIDEADGASFIAMEYVEGESLADKIRTRPLPLDEALDIAVQAAEGLHAAHKRGVVHRDVKPANIMIDLEDRVKIMDFGLAFLTGKTRITKTGSSLGTPAYMSPEQVKGEATDHRTDVWSLAVVLYEMLAGQLPFKGENQEAVSHSIVYEEPEPLTALRTGVPVALDRIVGKALVKGPRERYQHVDELLVDLRQCKSLADRGEPATKPPPNSVATGRRWLHISLAAVVVLLIGAAIWRFIPSMTGPGPGQVSVAVLPLRLLSAEAPQQEFLSFGLTEQLITHLAQISSLNVVAHTSVLRFKDTEQAIPEIGRMLNVDHIVEGSVVRIEDQIRVTAQLIETATDHHVWAGTYQRKLEDILSLQDEVAQAIAQEIHVSLTPEESQRLARSRQVDPRAYEAYLQGKFLRQQLSDESLGKAIEKFKLAIKEDPSYAPSYAALADAYLWAAFYGFESGKKLCPVALAAAVRAVELDGNLAEAHAALALSQAVSWDWPQAKRSFDRAFELNPGIADIHAVYAAYWLWPQGKTDEAVRELERAVQLDPLSAFSRIALANITFGTGDLAKSIEMLEAVVEQSPSAFAYLSLAPKYARVGRCEEAMNAMENARASGSMCVPCRALDLALCGRETQAREQLLKAEQTIVVPSLSTSGGEEWPALRCCTWLSGSPAGVALAYAALGETDKTFEWLERAYEERDIFLIWVKPTRVYDPLRSDPRYADLLRRMNLEP